MIIDKRLGRRGGFTYAGLLQVIGQCTANPKKRAAVLCGNYDSARYTMRMCFEMITPLLGTGFATFHPQRRIIEFENGSCIHFVTARSLEDRLRGSKFQIGMIDNSVDSEAQLPVQMLCGIVRD